MSRSQKKFAALGAVAGLVTVGAAVKHRFGKREVVDGSTSLTVGDWKVVLNETRLALRSKNLPTLAAGVAYFSTLAIFPFLAAAVALAALLITPHQLQVLAGTIEVYLPEGISEIITEQLQSFVARRADNSLVALVAIVIALIGASGASRNLVIASNVAYGVQETRSWFMRQIWGVAWIVAGIGFGFGVIVLLSINTTMLAHVGITSMLASAILTGRWLTIFLLTIFGLAIFYRFGPDRPDAKWRWVSWGAIIAAIVWMLGTTLFFVYIQNFASFAQTYSVFAGVFVLMTWMNLSALIILLGAEVNHRLDTLTHKKGIQLLSRSDRGV